MIAGGQTEDCIVYLVCGGDIHQHFASLPLHAISVLVTACRTQCITAVAGIDRTRVRAGGTRTCTLLVLPRTGV